MPSAQLHARTCAAARRDAKKKRAPGSIRGPLRPFYASGIGHIDMYM